MTRAMTTEQLQQKLMNVSANMRPALIKGMGAAVNLVERRAKLNCTPGQSPYSDMDFPSKMENNPSADGAPFDTGRLRSSINGKVETDTIERGNSIRGLVGTNVEYAQFVHDGTSKMQARPFLFDAIVQEQAGIYELMRKAVVEACLKECESSGMTLYGATAINIDIGGSGFGEWVEEDMG